MPKLSRFHKPVFWVEIPVLLLLRAIVADLSGKSGNWVFEICFNEVEIESDHGILNNLWNL